MHLPNELMAEIRRNLDISSSPSPSPTPASLQETRWITSSRFRVYGIHPWWAGLELMRCMLEFQNTRLKWKWVKDLPQGQGQPVLLVSGMPFLQFPTTMLGKFLKRIGYCVFPPAESGTSVGWVNLKERMLGRVEQIAAREGKVCLIAHSQYATAARELGLEHPELFSMIITLGMPDQKMTKHWNSFYSQKPVLTATGQESWQGHVISTTQQVPMFHVWSDTDGLSRRPELNLTSRESLIEVQSSHLGMLYNWKVFSLIAEKLATLQKEVKSAFYE